MLLNGVLGGGVTLLLILPPPVHLVTGPIGPLVGGFVAGSRLSHRSLGAALGTAAVMALTVAAATSVVAVAVLLIVARLLHESVSRLSLVLLIPPALGLYTIVLGTVGVFMGMARRERKRRVATSVAHPTQ